MTSSSSAMAVGRPCTLKTPRLNLDATLLRRHSSLENGGRISIVEKGLLFFLSTLPPFVKTTCGFLMVVISASSCVQFLADSSDRDESRYCLLMLLTIASANVSDRDFKRCIDHIKNAYWPAENYLKDHPKISPPSELYKRMHMGYAYYVFSPMWS